MVIYMYKILIVDDELWIRKGIIAKLQQLGLSFAWIGEAEDAENAVQIIQQEAPDIVITDIRLSKMSGIDLIREIRKTNHEIRFIIISGYAEFNYAEQALNMGVSSYLLKPVPAEILGEAIGNVMRSIKSREENILAQAKSQSLERRNAVLVHERNINRIFHSLSGSPCGDDAVGYDPFGTDKKNYYMMMLIHIDNSNYIDTVFKYEDLDLMKYAIKNIADEICPTPGYIIIDNLKDVTQLMVIAGNSNREDLQKNFHLFTYDLYAKVMKYVGITVTIALSGICDKIAREMFLQATDAYDMRLINGDNKIYHYISEGRKDKISLPEHQLRLFDRYIEMRDFKNVQDLLNDVFSQENMKNTYFGYVRNLYFEVIRIILKHSNGFDEITQGAYTPQMILGEVIDHYDNPRQVVDYLYDTIIGIYKEQQNVSVNCREIVGKAKDFIQKYYVKDLSVKDLANHFSINANYFSTIFKQETGVTLTNYLKDTRIEKACELLKNTNSTISDIAQIVGYEDTQYFYRVFKKAVGQTPLEYRKYSTN